MRRQNAAAESGTLRISGRNLTEKRRFVDQDLLLDWLDVRWTDGGGNGEDIGFRFERRALPFEGIFDQRDPTMPQLARSTVAAAQRLYGTVVAKKVTAAFQARGIL